MYIEVASSLALQPIMARAWKANVDHIYDVSMIFSRHAFSTLTTVSNQAPLKGKTGTCTFYKKIDLKKYSL